MDSSPSETAQAKSWLVLAESSRGSAHEAMGMPNQDAHQSAEIALGDGEGVAVAVADGHGNWRHFRSGSGSRFAVGAACDCVADAAQRLGSSRSITEIEAVAKDEIIPSVVEQWRSMVASDVGSQPFTDVEEAQRAEGDTPEVAYGSTLMLAVWTPQFVLCIQIGDGDILCVQPDGTALLPVPIDPSLDGHRTTSLCQTTALDSFRLGTVDRSAAPVAAVLLATDGYGNSQVAEPWQPVLSADLAEMLEQKGPAWVGSRLKEWTDRSASPDGSGDDTTVALILTPDHQSSRAGAQRSRGRRWLWPWRWRRPQP